MTAIEAQYVGQGYQLPPGWTWEMVEKERKHWIVPPIMVPVAAAGGATAWGVPFHNGRPLAHKG